MRRAPPRARAPPPGQPRKFVVTGAYKTQSGQDLIALAADDGRQAVRLVRERAGEFGVRPDRVGMIGFSAGGIVTSEPSSARRRRGRTSRRSSTEPEKSGSAEPRAAAVPGRGGRRRDGGEHGRPVHGLSQGKGEAELHVFQMGAHGFVNKGGGADHFMDRLEEWLRANKVLAAK